MKDGTVFVNLSRGFVVDIPVLKAALESGKISGAYVDVFPADPRANGSFENDLKVIPNVIHTQPVDGNTVDAINFPNIRLPI